ncbi:MAG: efflux RND transporter permease subunit [Bacteroidaceae bacterium]|nr:efflux RND transporter permease subunit [Bacteroidaceae bacterium]
MAKGNIFVERKVMACAISIVIAFIGLISLKTLPVEQYPDIAPPTIFVSTSYTGADANTVMKSVVMPLEEAINGVQDMAYISSAASSNGSVEIQVFFKQGTDADMAAVNVQNRVSGALGLLPSEVTKVGVQVSKRQNSMLQITSLVSRDGKFETDFLANYVDINVKPRIQRISGVGEVQNLGNTYSLRIWMKPDVMARYGLEPNDVFAAIGRQNLVAAAGSLGEQSENTYQYTMEYRGRLTSVAEFENIILRANTTGSTLYLKDVADVELGALSYSFTSSVDQEPGVVFVINQAAGANATQVNAEINKLYEEIERQLPPGMEFETLLTSDDFLNAAMHSVIETLIIAILLVILVVYFFLQDFKATLVPSISIIVSLLGTFAVVKMAGFSLNILTLFALVLAIGTVVDDAIVVVEAVMAKLETGYRSSHKATQDAMGEVSVAVISCTLVFMAVFIPVTFMPGTSGSFFTQFGVTIASSVGLSCVCAMTLCPALCAILMKPAREDGDSRKGLNYYTRMAYQASYNAIFNKYSKAVPKFIKRPKLAWLILIAAGVLMVFLMKVLPSGLVPQEDQGVVLVDVSAPAGSTLHETDLVLAQVEEKVKALPEVESYARVAGWGLISGTGSSYGTLIVRLKHWDDRKGIQHIIDLVIARLYYSCEDIKDAVIIPFQMPQIPGYGNSNSIELILEDLQGGDMSVFNEHANEFLAKLQERPEIQMAASTYSESFPKYRVDVNPVQCDKAGVSPEDVLGVLGAYCGGAYIGNYNQYGKVYRVMASAAPDYRLDPTSLDNIFIRVNGEMSPISQFVTLTQTVGSASMNRFNLYQCITCQVSPGEGFSEGDAIKAIREVAAQLPQGYGYEFGGMSRELAANADSNMTGVIYMICVILIYLILGCLYESWFIPFAVLLSVPFGLMGSFLFSKLCGMENNIYLQTGVIMLIGLLAKTAILITEFAVDKHKQGMPVAEAALGACHDRLRPILMTVLTMIAGMIPLIVEGGAGANGNRSLAIGVVGGMSIGTLALLFVVPCFYITFQKLHDRFQKSEITEEQ